MKAVYSSLRKCFWLGLILTKSTLLFAQTDLFQAPERGFTSWLPAPNWDHGLLSGNGTMGALVFGHPHDETIIMSQSQLYLPQDKSDELIDQASRLEEIRSLIRAGKYVEATKIPVELRETAGYSDQRDPFIPAFDIRVKQEYGNISKYVRATDFETGEAKTTWTDDNGTFQRTIFVSRADSIAVLRITGNAPINASIRFERRPVNWDQWAFVGEYVDEMKATVEDGWLTYKTSFKKHYQGSLEGYEGAGRLVLNGGSSKVVGNHIEIQNAKEVLLLIDIQPNYNYSKSLIPEVKEKLSAIQPVYEALLKRHKAVHGEIFNRVKLDLGGEVGDKLLHSEEILLKGQEGDVPLALIEKTFDAGRYNILSSTGTNPPNLQGIWSGTWTAAWASGFTHDGNLPSAMSVVMSGNMPELMSAYVGHLERYRSDFEDNAKRLFGARGVNLPGHTTTSGRPTDFNETWCLTFWTGGAGWAADIVYDYYRYTEDFDYLKTHAYPWMKSSALFYEDFLQEADGKIIFNPSYSPENNPANSNSQAVLNATMDVMIARQLLTNTIAAGKLLGESKAQLKVWQRIHDKLPEYQVNEEGVLKEWIDSKYEDNYRHRHVSQLYTLYNDKDADILDHPELKMGAINLLEKKLEFRREEGGGEMAFGHVQLGLTAAHLGEASKALETVNWLSSRYWSTGFGSFHNVGNLLNTDISGGLPAVIIQMLAYSEKGEIHLLPALPKEWSKGSLDGTLLRGQIELSSLSWNGNQVEAQLVSQVAQKVTIELPSKIEVATVDGVNVEQSENWLTVDLPAKKAINLSFILNNE